MIMKWHNEMERHNYKSAWHNAKQVREPSLRGGEGSRSKGTPIGSWGEWFECGLGSQGVTPVIRQTWGGKVQGSMSGSESWEDIRSCRIAGFRKGPVMVLKFECLSAGACWKCVAWLQFECPWDIVIIAGLWEKLVLSRHEWWHQ